MVLFIWPWQVRGINQRKDCETEGCWEEQEQAILGDANPTTESIELTGEVNGRKICTRESTLT